ncbi:MAG: peptide MFS transporter [Rikenellaceae bacterium]
MFKGHPRGLFVLALSNMGERFGYYTMLAIFVLFLQAKFGLSTDETSTIFGTFLALVYFLPVIGGYIADRFLGYGKTITLGIVIMFFGYFVLAIPTGVDNVAFITMIGALALIAIGTGLFKGNVQALVGNLYDNPKYSKKRDLAYSLFYMCINIGAFFAPSAAKAISNYFLAKHGLFYNAQIPSLANQYISGTISESGLTRLSELANAQITGASENISSFATTYIQRLSEAYNYGFGVACISLVVSITIFLVFRNTYKIADVTARQMAKAPKTESNVAAVELTPKQTRERVTALLLVFVVVIFFWMSFHQNGLTMTYFARDYTYSNITGIERIGFYLGCMVAIIVAWYGMVSIFQNKGKGKIVGLLVLIAGIVATMLAYNSLDTELTITPEIFQQFNPFFIIILTPISIALFSWLAKRNAEPSAPRKIGIGMIIAAMGFVVLLIGSIGLPAPESLTSSGGVSDMLVSPTWLISTYFVLTIAELFLSPMGLSFVSKVAPPKYKGMMQGGWLAATAVGNYLVAIIGYMWKDVNLTTLWGVLVVCCLVSASFIFIMMKRLERTTKDA